VLGVAFLLLGGGGPSVAPFFLRLGNGAGGGAGGRGRRGVVGAAEGKMKAVPPGRHRNGVCTSFSVEAGRAPNRALASA
jgi:hypothetical protein